MCAEHEQRRAKVAQATAGSLAIGGAHDPRGISLYAVGCPSALRADAALTFHTRAAFAFASRPLDRSLATRVARARNPFLYTFRGSFTSSITTSTSSTVFALPSTAMSSRATKWCWWHGAYTRGATTVPWHPS